MNGYAIVVPATASRTTPFFGSPQANVSRILLTLIVESASFTNFYISPIVAYPLRALTWRSSMQSSTRSLFPWYGSRPETSSS